MKQFLPDKRIIHRMGYYSNQEGIAMRYIREDENWNEHLALTRSFIVSVVKELRPALVSVLGSGWLLDIPLQEMLNFGARVRLVDLAHPPGVVDSLAGDDAVEFVIDDVTGGLAALACSMAGKRRRGGPGEIMEAVSGLEYRPDCEQGLVLSVNLLSQLPTLPFDYLLKKGVLKAADEAEFSSLIQGKHLEFLKKHDSVIVTDTTELHTDRNGRLLSKMVVHTPLPEARMKREWEWEFDTGSSYKQGYTTIMQVVAMHL